MIIFVGGLIGAGKSTIAKGLATHFGIPYYDVDEIKKSVYRKDPNFRRNIAEGIPFSDDLRYEVFKKVFANIATLLETNAHIVVDETLHKREIRQVLYEEARRVAGDFIVVWVHAHEDLILERLGVKKRVGHILDDPLPLHDAFKREFEDFSRCVIDCPNNGVATEAVTELTQLLESIGSLVASKGVSAEVWYALTREVAAFRMGHWISMADRSRWWADYNDEILVVIGHFSRQLSTAVERVQGVFGKDVFEGITSHAWMGK